MNKRTFNRRQVLSATGVALIGGTAATGNVAANEHDGIRSYSADLTGAEQVPPVETDARGHATFEIDEDRRKVHYEIYVESICNVTQAHIHSGEQGETGPIIVWLYPEDQQESELIEGRFEGTLVEGTYTADDFVGPLEGASLAEANETAAEGLYLNIHTEQHPDGEIRGQIKPDGELEEEHETEQDEHNEEGEEHKEKEDDSGNEGESDNGEGDGEYSSFGGLFSFFRGLLA